MEMRTARSQAELDLGKVQIVTDSVAGSINGGVNVSGEEGRLKVILGWAHPKYITFLVTSTQSSQGGS